jgi:hypothetical protein
VTKVVTETWFGNLVGGELILNSTLLVTLDVFFLLVLRVKMEHIFLWDWTIIMVSIIFLSMFSLE